MCAMFSSHSESHNMIQQDCSYVSLEEECLDDIKSDLISLTLSDSNSNILDFDVKSPSVQSTSKSNCDASPVHTRKDTPSDSFLVILNSPSKDNSLFSGTDVLTQYSDVQPQQTNNVSSQKVMSDPVTLNNGNEKLSFSSMKNTTFQENGNSQNINGFTQPQVNQDRKKYFTKSKLSLSLHDVSRLPDFPLKCKSRDFSSDTIQSQSMTTISSGLKSKDSGLPRSVSCLSLSSGGKPYEHIQSKVKEYIRQIKEADERRKSSKFCVIPNKSVHTDGLNYVCDENDTTVSETTLTTVIRDLQYELQDREIVLLQLQDNYDKLLIKYAEAENRIDQLRFKVIDPSLKLTSQGEEHHRCYPGPDSLILNSENRFTSPHNKTLFTRADTKSLPFDIKDSVLNTIKTSNDKNMSNQKSWPSVAQFYEKDTKQSLLLNPLVKPYSSSIRLDKKVKALSHNSRVKTSEESLKWELSLLSTISSLHGMDEISVIESNKVYADDHLSSATSSYQKNICDSMENAVTVGDICDPVKSCANVCELGLTQSEQCNNMPVVSEMKIPEYTNGEETLCKTLLNQTESNLLHNTPFEKVARWQKSLPPLELIEPSCYGSLDCHSSGSKTSSQNFTKKFTSPGGHDSGCPGSELYNPSVRPNPVTFSVSQASVMKTDLIEAKNIPLRTNPKIVVQPMLNMYHKVAFQPVPYNRSISADGRMFNNSGDLHLQTSHPRLDWELQKPTVTVQDSLKLSEYLEDNVCSPSTIIPRPLNIDSCECWNLEVQLSSGSEDSSISLDPCDQKPKSALQDFCVPPLKLGSLLGGDDNDSENDTSSSSTNTNSIFSSGITNLSEAEGASKAHSSYDESVRSSHQGTSEGITYPSSTYVTSDSQANKPLDEIKVANNKFCPPSSNASDVDFKQLNYKFTKTYGREPKIKQHNNVQPSVDYAVERRINHSKIQNDFLQASATTSTSYKSIQPYTKAREIKHTSSEPKQYFGGEFTYPGQTNDCSISTSFPVRTEGCEPSDHHAIGKMESDLSRRKLLGSALRCLLLEFLNTDNCHHNGCICNRSSWKPAKSRKHTHDTFRKDEDPEVESDRKNIFQAHTKENLASTLSHVDCGAERTLSNEEELNSIVKAEISRGSKCGSDGISNVDSIIIPEDQPLEEEKYNLMKCLDEMDQCAQQLKARSETILKILAVHLKSSS